MSQPFKNFFFLLASNQLGGVGDSESLNILLSQLVGWWDPNL